MVRRIQAAFPFRAQGESATESEGRWRCPGCGSRLESNGKSLICRGCQLDVEPFLYELLELNPRPAIDEVGIPADLIPFWITTHRRSAGPGFGVTGYDLDDAIGIAEKFGCVVPRDSSIIAHVRYENLDPFHVAPKMGPMVVRGLWYPFMNIAP